MIDSNLQTFLKEENIKEEKLLEVCKRISEVEENGLYCLDFILACTEYDEFYRMMLEYKVN
jgi:hypothetical protein